MISRLSKVIANKPKLLLSNTIRYNFSIEETLDERRLAAEKLYITKEEAKKLKKLHDKLVKEGYKMEESDDVDVDVLLEDRDYINTKLNEFGIINNEPLVKELLRWKYKKNN